MEQRRDPQALNGHKRLVPRSGRPPKRPEPLADPRAQAPVARPRPFDPVVARAGRRAGLVTALVGVGWIALTWAGQAEGWSPRARALVDLFALAGFGFALYLTWQVWRLRRADKGSQ